MDTEIPSRIHRSLAGTVVLVKLYIAHVPATVHCNALNVSAPFKKKIVVSGGTISPKEIIRHKELGMYETVMCKDWHV